MKKVNRNLDENLEDWEQDKAEVRENRKREPGRGLGRSTRAKPIKQKKEQRARTTKRRKYELVKEG